MRAEEVNRVAGALSQYVEQFRTELGRTERRHWCKMYLTGLLLDGERKSLVPMAQRISGGNAQALQQFLRESPWDEKALLGRMRKEFVPRLLPRDATIIVDDTSLPKKGTHSVGVARQYSGVLGKVENCQSIVSIHGVSGSIHVPLHARLYLPAAWTKDPARMNSAGVPKAEQRFLEKWQIALHLLDELLAEGWKPRMVLCDAAYGNNRAFREALSARGLPYVVYIHASTTLFDGETEVSEPEALRTRGRPRRHRRPKDRSLRPRKAKDWAPLLAHSLSNVTLPLQKPYQTSVASCLVYDVLPRPAHRIGTKLRFLFELHPNSDTSFLLSNQLQEDPASLLCIAHQRFAIEQGYQQLKEELGFDHFEGRSWRGLHHHMALCFLAFVFLQLLRLEQKKTTNSPPFPPYAPG